MSPFCIIERPAVFSSLLVREYSDQSVGICWSIPLFFINEPRHEISNNVVCATSICSDQPAHVYAQSYQRFC